MKIFLGSGKEVPLWLLVLLKDVH